MKLNKNEVAKWIEESVQWLVKEKQGCCRYQLDEHLAIFVGWSAGYGDEKRNDVIQDKDALDWGIDAGIKVWTSDYMQTDYDWINFPYYESGDVLDMDLSVAPNGNCEYLAESMLEWYEDAKHLRIADDGKIFGIELSDPLTEVIEKLDWCIDYNDDGTIYFSKYSPAGQDFGFEVGGTSLEEIAENIYDYYDGYDASYEASLWLDSDGHGKNGAPYDMKDLYEDMEACEQNVLELYNIIKEAC